MRENTILLVEGRRASTASLLSAIEKTDHLVLVAHTFAAAARMVQRVLVDVVVFDSSTMRTDGWRTCQRLRQEVPARPFIHCRGADAELPSPSEQDALAPITFLQRPLGTRKLLNRLRAALPADESAETMLTVGDLTLFHNKRAVRIAGGAEHELTPKLYALLEMLMQRSGELVTRAELMHHVWHTDYVGDTRTLDVHVRWLRQLIEENPSRPKRLVTLRGRGYKLIAKSHLT
jgi:DNA-binding response OmpR family regulator